MTNTMPQKKLAIKIDVDTDRGTRIGVPNLLKLFSRKSYIRRLEKLVHRHHKAYDIMAQLMLALEVVIAGSHPVGTYVFDEVDAGVGGKAAIEVGRRLYKLSQHAQVIVVTHLPQVAAWADSHFVVEKDETGTVSQSDVRKVTGDDRIEEIARMLAGLENSVSAREHATELLSLRL